MCLHACSLRDHNHQEANFLIYSPLKLKNYKIISSLSISISSLMGDDSSNENTFRKEAFYGDGYEPTYTPLTPVPINQEGSGLHSGLDLHCGSPHIIMQAETEQEIDEDIFDQTTYENERVQPSVKQEESEYDEFSSQIPGNQDYITRIDDLFSEAPMESYIESILPFLHGKEGLITWYRSILICRLKGVHENPLFSNAPVQRKNTTKSSSAYKYAKDCFNLNSFINGDMTAHVDDIFTCRSAKMSQSIECQAESQQEKSIDIACTKQLIQSLRQEVNEIKKSHSETIKNLVSQINTLKKDQRALKLVVSRLEDELNAKSVLYDAKIKQMSSATKDLEHLNPFELNTRMNALEANNKRLDSNVVKLQAIIHKQSRNENLPAQCNSPIQQEVSNSSRLKSGATETQAGRTSAQTTSTGNAPSPQFNTERNTRDKHSDSMSNGANSMSNVTNLNSNGPITHQNADQMIDNQAAQTLSRNNMNVTG